jgi:Fe-S cluster biogenesis protein NfuA
MTSTESRPLASPDGHDRAAGATSRGGSDDPVAANGPDVEELARAVDTTIAAVEELDEPARTRAHELRAAIEGFHRPALVHIVRTLRHDPRGKELLFALVDDPLVRSVFALHGIIKPDPATLATRALDSVRPYLHSHGGDVELVRIEGGAAVVRLQGSCRGCSGSAVTLHQTVEEALVAAVEEIDRIEVLDDEPTSAFIPLESVGVRRSAEAGRLEGPGVESVPEQIPTRVEEGRVWPRTGGR